ncbi:MAG TPA: lamin tail domain-containing protein [Verrucomicrobiae bacterium]|jgi:regulation of enolase protein 1 (concanavalin A-like superfamily)|nr:lamin tail domain-containing protein [Verrucomicrobiae bacterium]
MLKTNLPWDLSRSFRIFWTFLFCGAAPWAQASLPTGWTDADIGSPGLAGAASVANGLWSVTGGGGDIWNAADQFNFASAGFISDGAVIAKVTSLQNTDSYAKAGVMIRGDSSAGAMNVSVVVTPVNGISFQWRNADGSGTSAAAVPGTAPVWLALTRSVNNFNAYYSLDGVAWTQIGSAQTFAMNGSAVAGLCVTAHNNSALNTATFTNVSLTTPVFGVYRQLWTNVTSLNQLTNPVSNPGWPNQPTASFTHVFTNFETEINSGMENYGQRVRALLVPPQTGAYTFWIASDDNSQLFLSTDETSAHSVPIASVTSWTGSEQWNEYPSQQSAPITLKAGSRYYIEAIMQQGPGGDNLAVGWQLPDGSLEQPLTAQSAAGTYLIPFTGAAAPPGIYAQSSAISVVEGGAATFSVLATNGSPLTYQWLLNGAPITATQPEFYLTNASIAANNQQTYSCVVSNARGAITSAPMVLTVLADTTPPVVSQIYNVGDSQVALVFSKPVTAATANDLANYAFTNGLAITGAALAADNVTLTLTTAPLVYGSNYVVVLNGVADQASTPVMIAADTAASFTASPYVPLDLGSAGLPSTVALLTNGLTVTTAGAGLGGANDQGNFQFQSVTGDFDVRVCLAGLGLSSVWAQAGLMARQTSDMGSPFAAALATPRMVGAFFETRATESAAAVTTGTFPVNYPNTWLRLRRSGNTFFGFASYDGQTWAQLGASVITMPSSILLGLTVASHDTNQLTSATFLNYSNTPAGVILANPAPPHEPLGASSRTTPIVFSEIMCKPAPRTDTNNCEFIELYNTQPWAQDVGGYRVACADMSYSFAPGSSIPGGGFVVLAASPGSLRAVYGLTNALAYQGSLKKAETLQLFDEQSNVLLTVPYTGAAPWPIAAAGTGHSLVLANPSYGEGDPRAWDISDVRGGSPGAAEAYRPSALRNVVLNEVLPYAAAPFVELYNHSAQSVDVSGCILTDDTTVNKCVLPAGSVLPPGGFLAVGQPQLGFALNPAGGTIFLVQSDASRVLDAVAYTAQAQGVSWGRWPDGANDFYSFQTNTPGTNNSAIAIGPVAINELMYDPISESDDDQYIELYNQGTNTISLSGWQLSGGVTYAFPSSASIPANGYVVVGRNVANLLAKYANLTSANTFGNFSGKLSHNGERVALTMPQPLYVTNSITVVEDEVTYGVGGRWGQWAAGGGSSLELIDPHANHRLAANWADSDETAKSVWTNIENTGVLDNGGNYDSSIQHAQLGLLDTGECLVDNVEVDFNGVNYIPNPGFEGNLGGWALQGDHSRSSREAGGYQSNFALHLRASDRVWTGLNSCQVNLSANSMAAGSSVTLRFKARWLHGWPEALLRLNGNWLEATGKMPLPNNLGSPGAPNSVLKANAGPAIYQVTHAPSVPPAGQPLVVSARVHDPDGLFAMAVHYRIDPSTTYTTIPMNDTGANGDAVAGDGIYSASIPAQGAKVVVAFYVTATDGKGVSTQFPALVNDNAPVRECVAMFGDTEPGGAFETCHVFITQTNINRWANLADLSNETSDFTVVNNTRVIYNAQGRFAGSPYHQNFDTPTGNPCHYKWVFPDDDKYLGATDFNKIHQPGNFAGDDASLQREQVANSFLRALGQPWLNRRYLAVYVNGNRRGGLMEDAQTPSSDLVKEHFPNDTGGFLFKMQPWFEFAPLPSGSSINFAQQSWCDLLPFTTTGGAFKTARYRYMFEMRRTPDSANNYTDVFSLIQAASSSASPNFAANMKNFANMENWMRVFAANHAAGNWDSFGSQSGQNLYGYIGALGTKYTLLMWDFNLVLGNPQSWGPGQNLLTLNSEDANIQAIFAQPEFLRMYWRALGELVTGPLSPAVSGPLCDAKYQAFVNSGVTVENPRSALLPWMGQAASSIAAQLAAVDAGAFSVNPNVTISNNVAYVSGVAPVKVATIAINGVNWPLVWTGLTTWTVAVPLADGTTVLNVAGLDRSGQPIAGATGSAQAVVTSPVASPVGQVALNEIMYSPAVTNAQFIELYNHSTNTEFDLSGWQIPALSYVFPSGSVLAPSRFLTLAANFPAYAAAYGGANTWFDTFSGVLPASGPSYLSLVKPGASNTIVTQVAYSDHGPWPTNLQGLAASLQLLDARQDNWRAGNWAAVPVTGRAAPQWVHVTATGAASSSVLYIYLQSAGDIYVDDVQLVAGSVAEAGPNLVTDGDFESGFPGTAWHVSANLTASTASMDVKHTGANSLHAVSSSPGMTQSSAIWQTISPALTGNGTYTLSFWYLQSTNGGPLTLRLSGSGIVANADPAPPTDAPATPGAANSVATVLAPFPTLWINELEANNLSGLTNSAGQRAPWIEIYNPGSNAVSLAGLYLDTNYTTLTNWSFPAGTTIAAGAFKVIFADGLTNLTTANELHAGFTLPASSGSVVLSQPYNGTPQVLDYVDYADLPANFSYGSFPDGQSFIRQEFAHPTPGGANNGSALPPASFIPYLTEGSIYTQNFDALPNPGATSVGSDNPVKINGITYHLSNPFDFAYPVSATGLGGAGLSAMAGWYGLADPTASAGVRFGATDGDDTTGGDLSFGLPNSANRALGLLATGTTGYTAFGAKFINGTGVTLNYINVQCTAEVWRQSNLAKTVQCFYFIDNSATNNFSTLATGFLPALNLVFPTVGADTGGKAVDGTTSGNQYHPFAINQYIGNWPSGAALWLTWEMASPAGKAQGMGIDDFSFSATAGATLDAVPVSVQTSGTNLVMGWTGMPGQTYQIQSTTNLAEPDWQPVGAAIPGTGAAVTATNGVSNAGQQFYRLEILPPAH